MDNWTIIPLFLIYALCLSLCMAFIHIALRQFPGPEIDIEKAPPSEEQMRNGKEQMTRRLKRERNMLILISLPPAILILYLHMNSYTSTATTLPIIIATAFLMIPIAYYTSKNAIDEWLQIFQPMPKEHSQQLLEWCTTDKTCDQYRLAILKQRRDITLAEYKGATKWIEKRKEKEKTELQEEQYRRLYQDEPIT